MYFNLPLFKNVLEKEILNKIVQTKRKKKFRSSSSCNKFNISTQIASKPNPYILLVGAAGTGKTTVSKRIVTSSFEEGRFALFVPLSSVNPHTPIDLKCFCCSMNYFSSCDKFSDTQSDESLAWLLANQHKVTLVLDGLDQARFKVARKSSSNADVRGKYPPSELLFLLLSRTFLPDVRLVLTTRPRSCKDFFSDALPSCILVLDHFAEMDTKKLLNYYIKTGNVDQVVEKLFKTSPRVHRLINCPLFLRFFASLVNSVGLNEIWPIVKSTSNFFEELLNRITQCTHNTIKQELEDTDVLNKISKLAYKKTLEKSIAIDNNDLSSLNIEPSEIKDLSFGFQGYKNNVLVGPNLFYFAHQSIQVSLIINFFTLL